MQNQENVPTNPPDLEQIKGIFCAQSPLGQKLKVPFLVHTISNVQNVGGFLSFWGGLFWCTYSAPY